MEPCDLSAVAARALIAARALSPLELVDSCLARIAAVNPVVNACVALDTEVARTAARAAEGAGGPLHGLPLGIKDLDATAGLRTTYGSLLYADHVPDADDGVVARLRAAGGSVLAKTNTPEFGAGANTRNAVYGATGNPFDPTLSAAGSSGGSAAALACGMVLLATGSDLGGSLRNPASFCGVVGFRPSPGVVADETRGQAWSPLPVLGPMARSVADTVLLLDAMAGPDARDPLWRGLAAAEAVDPARLRVAFSPDLGFAPVERAVAASFAAKVAGLDGVFARLEPAAPDCAGTDEAFAILRAVGFLAAHAGRAEDPRLGPNVRANLAEGAALTASDVARALNEQTRLMRVWDRFFAQWDVLVTPAVTIVPRPWTEWFPAEIDGAPTRSYYHWLALAYAVTLAGLPALCVPCGLGPSGMPFGLQLVGPRGSDRRLLALGVALEEAGLIPRPVPDLAALSRP